jgi:Phosphotransferase enzyme family
MPPGSTDNLPFQSVQDSVATGLHCEPSELEWFRFPNSRANFVYRATLGKRSVIVKTSDNLATLNDWHMPHEHLLNEHNFLRSLDSSVLTNVQLPRSLEYFETDNTLVMTDLGNAKWLLQGGFPLFKSKRKLFEMLGSNLALIHEFAYPKSFVDSLGESKVSEVIIDFKLGPRLFEGWDYLQDFLSYEPHGITLMDFGPRNILRTRPIGLIDFDFLGLGYQYFDVAHFLHFVLWYAIARDDKKMAFSLDSFLIGYCENRSTSIHPDQLINDSHFLTWLYSLFYRKFTRKPDRPQDSQMREFLLQRSESRSSSWQDFVEKLFLCREWL